MYDAINCFAVIQNPREAVAWDILAGICDPTTNCCLLKINNNCKLDPYSLCLGIFPYRIWSFQPVCISEDCLSFTKKKPRQKRWVALFKTTELLPWPWVALSGYRHLGLSLGFLKNLIMDSGFIEYSAIFCWLLYSVTSFRVWVQLLHLCIGSADVQACFYSDSKVLVRHDPGTKQQLPFPAGSQSIPPPPSPSSPYLLAPAPSSPQEQEM